VGLIDYSLNDKKYFNSGREYERERIIKLIQEQAKDFLDQEYDRKLLTVTPLLDTDGLIKLIKEN
jgi:hypothetical protein